MVEHIHEAYWTGIPKSEISRANILEGDMTGRFAFFVKNFEITTQNSESELCCNIAISANARYRLWVNGKAVHSGPEKGNLNRYYYDVIDISAALRYGNNVIAVQVLYQDADAVPGAINERASIYAVVNPGGGHRLMFAGAVMQDGRELVNLTTGMTQWRCRINETYYLTSPDLAQYFLGAIQEKFDVKAQIKNWKTDSGISSEWAEAETKELALPDAWHIKTGFIEKFQLQERDIPLMYESEEQFARELTDTGIMSGKLEVPAHQNRTVILDVEYVKNTYPYFTFHGGADACVKITYYEKHQEPGQEPGRRDDISLPSFYGQVDELLLDGTDYVFEPFWFRTFRFLKMEIQTKEEPAVVELPRFVKSGYPITRDTSVKAEDEWVEKLFEMSTRTLESCMTETYNDSPHYEQMQYPMDTRLQMLFNMKLSKDLGLVRKALNDLHDAILPMGLMPGKAPTVYLQIISTFSLHYIFALWEYYYHTKDIDILRRYRSDLDRILDYYDSKIDEKTGLVGWIGYWPFVDWQPVWDDKFGTPLSREEGPSTIINLMYAYALQRASDISKATGRKALAEEYLDRADSINKNVNSYCFDKCKMMYKDGPFVERFSIHSQSWAVLTGCVSESDVGSLMRRSVTGMQNGEVIPVSFSTANEFFRACEKAGCYELTWDYMKMWINLIDMGCGTCPETPVNSRSECHAWSALPIYEIIHGIAGINAAAPGWEKVKITPHLDYIGGNISGTVTTPKGDISFKFTKTDDVWQEMILLPNGMERVYD